MKSKHVALWLTLTGGILFNFFFWKEGMGINTVLFSAFVIASLFVIDQQKFLRRENLMLASVHLISALLIVWQHNSYGMFAWIATLLLLGGSFQTEGWRSLLFIVPAGVVGYAMVPVSLFKHFERDETKKENKFFAFKWFGKFVKFGLIPTGVLIVFTLIYQMANPVFNEMMQRFWSHFGNFIAHFFQYFSVPRILFSILGMIILGGLILYAGVKYFGEADAKKTNDLKRKPRVKLPLLFRTPDGQLIKRNYVKPFSFLGLKTENITGIITLALLNGLLFLLNALDVQYVWMQKAYKVGDIDYSNLVHKGTGFLIASIILSMLILLFMFRRNLNFFKPNSWLKFLAYLWIAQNIFMVSSVFLRDVFYIQNNGITYKRIGVIVYLSMTAFGLLSLFYKIYKTKTLYFLLRINGWFALLLLLAMSSVNWDGQITNYNLNHRNTMQIDESYLLGLGNAALPALIENENIFDQDTFKKQLFEYKKTDFKNEMKAKSWLSWNYSDALTSDYLNQ